MNVSKYFYDFLWTAPFLTFILGYCFLQFFITDTTISTPQITGKTIYDATKISSLNKLNLRIIAEKEMTNMKPGIIIKQKPQAGKPIKANQSIFIVTTKQPPAMLAPNFIHKNTKEISTLCSQLNLKNRLYKIETEIPVDQCFGQIPQPQQELDGKKLTTYVSAGNNKPYLFPDLTGYSLKKVMPFLKKYDVCYEVYQKRSKLTEPYSPELIVQYQKPLAGSFVQPNNTLHVQLQVH